MVQITEQATAVLFGSLSDDEIEDGKAFRFSDTGDGQIRVEKAPKEDGDIQLEREGTPVLFLPEPLADRFAEATVDVAPAEGNEGLRLVIRATEAE